MTQPCCSLKYSADLDPYDGRFMDLIGTSIRNAMTRIDTCLNELDGGAS